MFFSVNFQRLKFFSCFKQFHDFNKFFNKLQGYNFSIRNSWDFLMFVQQSIYHSKSYFHKICKKILLPNFKIKLNNIFTFELLKFQPTASTTSTTASCKQENNKYSIRSTLIYFNTNNNNISKIINRHRVKIFTPFHKLKPPIKPSYFAPRSNKSPTPRFTLLEKNQPKLLGPIYPQKKIPFIHNSSSPIHTDFAFLHSLMYPPL